MPTESLASKSNPTANDEVASDFERLREAFDLLPEAIAVFDAEDRFAHWNRKYAEFYGWGAHLIQRGRPFEDYLRELLKLGHGPDAEGRHEEWLAERMARHRLPFSSHEHEIEGGRWVRVEERRLANGGSVGIRIDITELKQRELRLAYLAQHDDLTGLGNRALLRERLEAARASSSPERPAAVVCLDLDRFKDVNDTLGHVAGDELLRQVADRLREAIGPHDTAVRFGGDEFAIVVADAAGEAAVMEATAAVVRTLSFPYDLGGRHVVIGASAGVALLPFHGDDPDTLLRHADTALYRAKADSNGTSRLFEPAMNLHIQRRRMIEEELRAAIGTDAIEVHYQPVVDLVSGRPFGAEALVRWRHPVRGLVPPAEFIGVAEDTGLIDALGEQVLREACRMAAGDPKGRRVAVNLSPIQFRRTDLVATVARTLREAGLSSDRLELEITESVLFADDAANTRTLRDLKSLGVSIALDDFGTGCSSLSHLRAFGFDRIKIDRSFVREIGERADCRAIVRGLIRMSCDLGIDLTAEGVETAAQRDWLVAEGCRDGQGYLFGAAVPFDRLEGLPAG